MNVARMDGRLITCILPQGRGRALLDLLHAEHGQLSTALHNARGMGQAGASRRGLGAQVEKDILLVAVPAAIADVIFEFLYWRAGLDQAHAGIMFMERIGHVPLRLPEDGF